MNEEKKKPGDDIIGRHEDETLLDARLHEAAARERAQARAAPVRKTGGKNVAKRPAEELDLEVIDLSLEDVGLDDIWIQDETGKVSRDLKDINSALEEIEDAKVRRKKELEGAVRYNRPEDEEEGEGEGEGESEGEKEEDDVPKKRRFFDVLRFVAAFSAVVVVLAAITVGYLYFHPYFFPRPEPIFENVRELQVAGSSVHFRAGTERLEVPIPAGYQVLDPHSYFRQFPLAEKVARYEKCEVIFACKPTQGGKGFFINLALDDESRDTWYSERQFRNVLNKTITARRIAGALRVGQHRILEPFDVFRRSGCYGRIMIETSSFGATKFGQYSCMLYFGERVLILNAGFAAPGRTLTEEDIAQCRETLLAWRNQLLGEPEEETQSVKTRPRIDFKAPTRRPVR